jgi:hypothetical protein
VRVAKGSLTGLFLLFFLLLRGVLLNAHIFIGRFYYFLRREQEKNSLLACLKGKPKGKEKKIIRKAKESREIANIINHFCTTI